MGILDWITDGGGSLFGGSGGTPPTPQPDAAQMPPQMRPTGPTIPPMSFQRPEFANQPPGAVDPAASGSPAPPSMGAPTPPAPFPQGGDPMAGSGGGSGPGLPPPPMPAPRPAGANAPPAVQPPVQNAVPPPPPETPPGAAPTGGTMPGQSPGDAGLLGSAFGMNPHDAMMVRGSLGAGLKAAGNSAGKSPFQAATSGAGEAIEGGQKASETNNKQTIDYLNTAIKAKAAGDTAAYNVAYTKYLAAKLKADTDKAASGSAAKNDPNSLYFKAVAETNKDPVLKGLNDAVRAARASGDTAGLANAQAALEAKQTEILNGHFARVGLDPKVAAQIGQQPGMTVGNAIDAGKMGITDKNITQKLQPGQYYRNPKDGQIYQFNGGPAKGSTPDKPTTPTEPRDPNKPEKGSRASAAAADDEDEA